MSSVDRAKQTQMGNIQKKTGKNLEELSEFIRSSGLKKHNEIRSMLMDKLGLTYGDAHNLALYVLNANVQQTATQTGSPAINVLDELYSGPKSTLRPIHEKLMDSIRQFGDFEIAPKKGYVSLRRKRQFAMLGPATNSRVELGLNIKQLASDQRLIPQPAGSMCQYIVRLTDANQVDDTIIGWVKQAFDAAA